jgi:predicted unusual protein kinase regulating ubiquinone biosynthesis (AarF/ABC1/UbiB family)/CubicO group peptidase (beta-lactamase class C family)
VFVDYKLTQLRAADLQADESEPLYSAVHRRSAVRSLVIFCELQGLWVKLGQYLSSRADVIPDQYTEVYGALQDSMPARPLSEVQQTIEEDLGKPVGELFDGLQEEALAAASIGQVHRAKTKSGLEVAVKVKHRSIDRVLDQDLENLSIILGWMTFLEPDVDISTVMAEWSKEVRKELDLENEALQMMAVRENLIRDGLPVIVPRMPDRMFGKRVLVMRFIEGVKMSTPLPELDRMGVDREAMCRAVLRAFAHQIYVDGLFNGDPHPGNIMVIQRGALRDGDEEDVRYHRAAAQSRASTSRVPAAVGPAASASGPDGSAGADGASPYSSASGAATGASASGEAGAGVSPVMDGDPTEWVPVLLDFGLTKLLPRHVRLGFCKMVLAGQELDGNMLMEAFAEMGMRFSNENVLEDMEGIKHMFRDALPKQEARAQNKAKMEEDEAKKQAAKSSGGEQRKVEAWPGELILFMRVSELLNGLAAQLEVRVPTMQIMSAAARVGMLRRFPMPRVTLQPSAESVVASRLRITTAGGGSAARGGLRVALFAEPMLNLPPIPGKHATSPGSPAGAMFARTPIELERVIRTSLKHLKSNGAILGAQVAVFKDGVCVADVATGQMGPLDHRRVAPETRFPLYGVGRALVAAAAYEMSLAGKLSLDAGVDAVWPEFAEAGKGGCSVSALLRCRSGVEGWLPEKLTTSALLDSEAMAEGVATAAPRLLPALAAFDRKHAARSSDVGSDADDQPPAPPAPPAAADESADASSAGLEPDGDVLDLADKQEAARAAARGSKPSKPPATWHMVPQGPSEKHESCAHLYFGWSWASAELLKRAASTDSAAQAVSAHVGEPLSIAAEIRLGPVAAPETGPGSTGALPEPVDGGGQDTGEGSPPDEDIFAPVATVELSSEDELRSAAKKAARAGSVSGAASEASLARTASRASMARSPSAGGLGGAGDATALGSEAQEEEEDEAQADAHVMRTLMAAVAFHGALGSAGLGDLEGLVSGGKEHLVDPRAVNAKSIRAALMPATTMFASARAVACAGASLIERLVHASGGKPYATVTADAAGSLSSRLHDGPVARPTPASVTVSSAAYDACRLLGFRMCPFTRPDGVEEGRGFALGGMGGSILLCDPASRVSVAITVNRLLPRRGQTKRILKDLFTALSVGVPSEALAGAL